MWNMLLLYVVHEKGNLLCIYFCCTFNTVCPSLNKCTHWPERLTCESDEAHNTS